MIIIPILRTLLIHSSLKGWENELPELQINLMVELQVSMRRFGTRKNEETTEKPLLSTNVPHLDR